jgi:DNA ligase 1
MQPLLVMQRLAATNSRLDKEQIVIDAFMAGCEQFFLGARLACDPLITFGQKKIAEILEDDGDPGNYTYADFVELAEALRTRKLTGHAARDAIHAAAERCHAPTWNQFYRRILLKDLGVGLDESTINKVLNKLASAHPKANDYIIPVFKCQLSHNGDDDAHKKKIRGKKLVDTKLDGMRILGVLDKESGTVTLFSRNGQTIDTFPEMNASLAEVMQRLPGSIVLDGELMSPHGFQHLMTLVKRKEGHPDTGLIQYAVFDVIPLKDFFAGYCAKPQRDRRTVLETMQSTGMFANVKSWIYVVPQIEVDLDTTEGRVAFAEFNRRVLLDGFEGIMVKDPKAPYEGKRTAAWLKMKPKISVTLEITGFDPGKPDGKYAHTLGALVCSGIDEVEIATNVSGGIDDKLRDEIWANRPKYLGMMVELEADKLTLEEGAIVHSLRFPVLKGFRGRVPGEKL